MLKSGARFCSESVSLDEKAGLGGTRTNVGSWGSSSRGDSGTKADPCKGDGSHGTTGHADWVPVVRWKVIGSNCILCIHSKIRLPSRLF